MEREREFLIFLKGNIFPIKIEGTDFSDHSNLKILTPKWILQRLPIYLAQLKTSSTSETLLSKIRQTICSLDQEKEITKKV